MSALVAGRIGAVHAREGQRVRAGDLLVEFDADEARAAVARARASVEAAEGRLDQLRQVGSVVAREASRQAEANLEHAEAELARVMTLTAAGAMTRADLDVARRNVELARAQRSAADAQQTGAAPTGAEYRTALSAVVQSRAELSLATVRLGQTRVVAPQDGVILGRTVETGNSAQAGTPLLEMAADGDTLIVIEPDERNLAWLRVGQQGVASADAYSKETFAAEVSYIAPAVDPRRGSIEVRLRVPAAPAHLRPDMTVSVDLTVASRARALAVPSEAVRGAGTAAPWVLVVEAGRVARRAVTLGLVGEGDVEIASGIQEGTDVVVEGGQALAEGQRVRPVRRNR